MPTTVNLTIKIHAPGPIVFAAVTDLAAYNEWLDPSTAFKGTVVSETPVRLGTTYTETSGQGVRYGEVIEFQEPTRVTFSQPMILAPAFLGIKLGIKVHMVVTQEENGISRLDRTVELEIPFAIALFRSVIKETFRKESWRTMEKLKAHLESKQQATVHTESQDPPIEVQK